MSSNELSSRVKSKLDQDLNRVIMSYSQATLKMKRVTNKDIEEILMTYERLEYPWTRREKVKTCKTLPNLRAVFPVSPKQPNDHLQFIQPPEKSDKLNILVEMERKKDESRQAELVRSSSSKPKLKKRPKSAKPARLNTTVTPLKTPVKPLPVRTRIVKKGELDDILKRLTKRSVKPLEIPIFRQPTVISRPTSAPPAVNCTRIIRMTETELKKKAETKKMVETYNTLHLIFTSSSEHILFSFFKGRVSVNNLEP